MCSEEKSDIKPHDVAVIWYEGEELNGTFHYSVPRCVAWSDKNKSVGYDSLESWRVDKCFRMDPTCGECCQCCGGRPIGWRELQNRLDLA